MQTTKPRSRPPRVDPGTVNRLLALAVGRHDDGVTAAAAVLREILSAAAAAQDALTAAKARVDELHAAGTLWDAKPMATAMARRSIADIVANTAAAAKESAVAALRSALTRVAVTAADTTR